MLENREMLVINDSSRQKKDARQRLTYFADWLSQSNMPWYLPELDTYRDFLLFARKLSSGSVATHIGSIRMRYETLLEDETVIEKLHVLGNATESPDEFFAMAIEKMKNATSKESGRVEYKRQSHVSHLSSIQLDELFAQPDIRMLQGLRDVLAIGLIFSTGINEAELCALQVSDLQRTEDGELQINVPAVLEGTARTAIIYDYPLFSQSWVESYLAAWLYYTGIEQGRLMRGFFRGGMKMSPKEMTFRGIQQMLKDYLVHDQNGSTTTVTVLELRRTYARWLYLAGVEFELIQKSLGHLSPTTTLEYIGLPSPSSATPNDLRVSAEPLLSGLRQYWSGAPRLSISSGDISS